ncbi:hypothetical protein AC622_17225 [Bacillus sp. FJAT-27916]|uniref:hypothetical protein n=1 Tax=Bacillaceae TaxID=186817 RepID=UPI000671482E|nr:hypothetical protein [Bacillus sp. FJAT-27916]KMY45727.1 hypothetical protein AC622_17225 [Bacillus sp. FJAT-27916]
MSNNKEYVNVKIDVEQLRYMNRLHQLLCQRLDMDLPKEYEIPEIAVEQALFTYIDQLERFYRLTGEDWEKFYQKWSGVHEVPEKLKDFKERIKGWIDK